jgi:hypothetical protein
MESEVCGGVEDETEARDEGGGEAAWVGNEDEKDAESVASSSADAELTMDGVREWRGVRRGVRCGDGDALAERDLTGDGLLYRDGVRLSLLA